MITVKTIRTMWCSCVFTFLDILWTVLSHSLRPITHRVGLIVKQWHLCFFRSVPLCSQLYLYVLVYSLVLNINSEHNTLNWMNLYRQLYTMFSSITKLYTSDIVVHSNVQYEQFGSGMSISLPGRPSTI